MRPLLSLLIPPPTRGDDVQMGVVLATATMGLNHHDVATSERLTTHPAKAIIQTSHPTSHQRTQQVFRLSVKRRPEHLGHGQDNMAIDDPLMQHPADLAHPVVDVDFGASQA